MRCPCPGRNAAWPQRAAASCFAQPRVGCGHDALQIRDLTELRRLVGACLKHALPKQNANSAKVPDQRSTTTRRYRPSGFARARAARRGGHGTQSFESRARRRARVSKDEAECAALTLRDAGSEAAAGSSQGEGESVARSSYGRVPLELNGRQRRALRAVPTIGNRPRGHGAHGQARKSKQLGARAFAHPTKVIRFHRDLL